MLDQLLAWSLLNLLVQQDKIVFLIGFGLADCLR